MNLQSILNIFDRKYKVINLVCEDCAAIDKTVTDTTCPCNRDTPAVLCKRCYNDRCKEI